LLGVATIRFASTALTPLLALFFVRCNRGINPYLMVWPRRGRIKTQESECDNAVSVAQSSRTIAGRIPRSHGENAIASTLFIAQVTRSGS
jgi:hypothetical protein